MLAESHKWDVSKEKAAILEASWTFVHWFWFLIVPEPFLYKEGLFLYPQRSLTTALSLNFFRVRLGIASNLMHFFLVLDEPWATGLNSSVAPELFLYGAFSSITKEILALFYMSKDNPDS